jgi:FkbM family methyltransferase
VSLFESQLAILGRSGPRVIFDVGAHEGHTTVEYLEGFPNATVFAFEPDEKNYVAAENMLRPFSARVHLSQLALSNKSGGSVFHVNSHSGTHSLLPIGEQRFWDGYASTLETRTVQVETIDKFSVSKGISHVDVLKMDIQGGELDALRGASELLTEGEIDLIALEVEFQELYLNQPLFWDIGAYLQSYKYGLYGLFDCHHSIQNSNVLSWADAIFLSPRFLHVSDWTHD